MFIKKAFTLGLALAPLAAGMIHDLTASYERAFELCTAISIVGAPASLSCVPAEWEHVITRTPLAAQPTGEIN